MARLCLSITLLTLFFSSPCLGNITIENRLESLERNMQVVRAELSEKDLRIIELENQISTANDRIATLELTVDQCLTEKEETADVEQKTEMDKNTEHQTNETQDTLNGQHEQKKKRLSSAIKRQSETPQVAFHAYLGSDRTYRKHEPIVFGIEKADVGGGYNNGDGIFNVPTSGVYVFTWSVENYPQARYAGELVINGSVEGSTVVDSRGIGITNQATGVVVVHVNRGDHIYVRIGDIQGTGYVVSNDNFGRSTFSGWLLYAD